MLAVRKEVDEGEDTMTDPKMETVRWAEAKNLYQSCYKEISQFPDFVITNCDEAIFLRVSTKFSQNMDA